jgi:DNA-binding response OmpR family regulator
MADALLQGEATMLAAGMRRPVRRALVVQEDPTNAYLLVRLLTRWGYDVVQVADAPQAWQHVSSWREGLVVVDNALASEPALDLCRRIKAAGSELTLILLGGRGDELSQARALAAGARWVLGKPFALRELADCLMG